MGNSCSPGCRWWCLWWRVLCCPFFPLDVLDEIWDLIESVSEGFLTYFWILLQNIYVRRKVRIGTLPELSCAK